VIVATDNVLYYFKLVALFINFENRMTFTDKHIIETYSGLFEGLSSTSKMELIESLSKSLKTEIKTKDESFYQSFGAFADDKEAEEIVKDIKLSRKFRKKEIKF
jgi:hypothetical protein